MTTTIKTDVINSSSDKNTITAEFRGLSTENKPQKVGANDVGNGSIFIEMDTSKIYFYDEENTRWLEFGGEPQTNNEETPTEETQENE